MKRWSDAKPKRQVRAETGWGAIGPGPWLSGADRYTGEGGVVIEREQVAAFHSYLDGTAGSTWRACSAVFGSQSVTATGITHRFVRAVDCILRLLRKAGLAEPCRDTSKGKSTPTWRRCEP
jgi:hypothetical protein